METELINILIEHGTNLVFGALAIFLAWVAFQGGKLLKTVLNGQQLSLMKTVAETVVRSLEQQGVSLKLDGPMKKRLASVAMDIAKTHFGVNLNSDMLDRIIEEAVQIMNAELGKFDVLQIFDPEEELEEA